MEKPENVSLGWVGGSRYPDHEKVVITEFAERENLSEMLRTCFDIAYAEPFDERYLDQKMRAWNTMEEKQRGFSGSVVTKFKHQTRHGVMSVLYYPGTDAVQLEYHAVK